MPYKEQNSDKISSFFGKNFKEKLYKIRPFLRDFRSFRYFNFSCKNVLGFGHRSDNFLLKYFLRITHKNYITVEDGFIKSVGNDDSKWPIFSMIVDDIGIYYDTRKISGLESIINHTKFDDQLIEKAKKCIETIKENKITRYNNEPNIEDINFEVPIGNNILLLDQSKKDKKVKFASTGQADFDKMFEEARKKFPEHNIIIKTPPHNQYSNRKTDGYLKKHYRKIGVYPIENNVNIYSLLPIVDSVFTVCDDAGMDALMYGKKLHCVGRPYYSGHGLTDDYRKFRRKRRDLTIEELFAASHILYPRYADPQTRQQCDIEEVLERIIYLKNQYYKYRKNYHCWGFSIWKRKSVETILSSPFNEIFFYSNIRDAIKYASLNGEELAVWATKEKHDKRNRIKKSGIKPLRIEDGFIRSIGLGSNFVPACSIVIDDLGVYYNPKRKSRLEEILNNIELNRKQKRRAKKLIELIVESRVSKYNFQQKESRISVPKDKKVILVVGQVEDDASITSQKTNIKSNRRLLEYARVENPKAFIIYKPHPDVVTGNRRGHIANREANKYADILIENCSISELIGKCNEVYTISSLVGFEALLQKKVVHCSGLPFYAGWGLTKDHLKISRRKNNLSLEDLVYGTLIEYPYYYNPKTNLPCEVEDVVELIKNNKKDLIKYESKSNFLKFLQFIRSFLGKIDP